MRFPLVVKLVYNDGTPPSLEEAGDLEQYEHLIARAKSLNSPVQSYVVYSFHSALERTEQWVLTT